MITGRLREAGAHRRCAEYVQPSSIFAFGLLLPYDWPNSPPIAFRYSLPTTSVSPVRKSGYNDSWKNVDFMRVLAMHWRSRRGNGTGGKWAVREISTEMI